jgi:hypothetical protein
MTGFINFLCTAVGTIIRRSHGTILAGVLLSTIGCGIAFGQGTAQITGAVKDQTGAVLPGVEVSATQTGTDTDRHGRATNGRHR